MADKPDDDTQTPEGGAEEIPEVDATGAEPAADAELTASDAPEADAPEAGDETPAEEPAGEEQPAAEETPTAEASEQSAEAEPTADAVPSAPAEQLAPKERRRKARSTHSGEARPPRSPEERHAERMAERREKAVRRRKRRLQERAKAAERRAAAPAPEPLAPVHAPVEGKRKVRQGIVVSDKAEKTITVRIDVARRHRRYEKIVRSSSTVHAHDENNDAHEGDVVRVIESRPLSRSKRWALVDVLERAQ